METPPTRSDDAARDAGIDALRGFTTLLVVLHHTALLYGGPGSWYWRERTPDGSLSSLALAFFCTLNQAWFMGLFFFLAGIYTPSAVARHGVAGFLWARCLRLGPPLLIYGLILGPATLALARTARGADFGATLRALWDQRVFEPGPLWFVEVLLVLAPVAALLVKGLPQHFGTGPDRACRPLPTDRVLAGAAVVVGVGAFATRLVWPVGTTWGSWQLGYFPGYLVLFGAGCAAAGPGWQRSIPLATRERWRRVMRWALPVLPVVALFGPAAGLAGRPEGGWSVPALVYAFWEPLVAWGLIMGLLVRCQRRFATAESGSFVRSLGQRAFAIYVMHPPVVVGVGLGLRSWALPPVAKTLLAGALACGACFVLAGILRGVPRALTFSTLCFRKSP